MLKAHGITKRYGASLALDRMSLDIPDQSIFGLLGPNGAGKTTFLRLVMGFTFSDAGSIDLGSLTPYRIGYLPERALFPPQPAIRSYLLTVGSLVGLSGAEATRSVDMLLARLDLTPHAGKRLGRCSRGMLQRVGLAQALLGDPPVLLFDEPTLGLDPAGQRFIREQILALHNSGKTVLLSSHNLGEVTRICTHVAVLHNGRLVQAGPLETILAPRSEVTILTGPIPDGVRQSMSTHVSGILVARRRVILSGDAVVHKDAVLRALLEAGVDVRQLAERHTTLEEAYMEATGS